MEALCGFKGKDKRVNQIRERLDYSMATGKQISIMWTKVHVGNVGNEAGDIAAKEGTELEAIEEPFYHGKINIKNIIKKNIKKKWQHLSKS